MLGQDRDLGQNAHPDADGDRGLDADETGARIGHVPRASGGFGGVDHAIAIEAALLGHHERQRIAAEIDRDACGW